MPPLLSWCPSDYRPPDKRETKPAVTGHVTLHKAQTPSLTSHVVTESDPPPSSVTSFMDDHLEA